MPIVHRHHLHVARSGAATSPTPRHHLHRHHHASTIPDLDELVARDDRARKNRLDLNAAMRTLRHLNPAAYAAAAAVPPPARPSEYYDPRDLLRTQQRLEDRLDSLNSRPGSYVNGETNRQRNAREGETSSLESRLAWVRRQLQTELNRAAAVLQPAR